MKKNTSSAVKRFTSIKIKSGEKPDEYRLVTDYWIKRLEGASMMKSMLSVATQRLEICRDRDSPLAWLLKRCYNAPALWRLSG